MPSPMKTGTTLMTNSSIACASRNEAMISPPPINQISLPGCSRRRLTNGPIAPLTNSTPDGASGGGALREKTMVRLLFESNFAPRRRLACILGLRFLRRFRLAGTVEGYRLANERLEGGLVNFFSFVDVNCAAYVSVETRRVEETGRILQRRALGDGKLHDILVGFASADDA